MDLRVGFRSCFSSTRKPRSSGRPASTSVANWRVKVVNTLDFTRPLRPGILMLMLRLMPLALFLGLARFGGRAGFLVGLLLDLLDFDDLGGEQPHFLDPADGFVLAGDLERALALLAMRVHRHVVVFGITGGLNGVRGGME